MQFLTFTVLTHEFTGLQQYITKSHTELSTDSVDKMPQTFTLANCKNVPQNGQIN